VLLTKDFVLPEVSVHLLEVNSMALRSISLVVVLSACSCRINHGKSW